MRHWGAAKAEPVAPAVLSETSVRFDLFTTLYCATKREVG